MKFQTNFFINGRTFNIQIGTDFIVLFNEFGAVSVRAYFRFDIEHFSIFTELHNFFQDQKKHF